jgi:hypothetical protein
MSEKYFATAATLKATLEEFGVAIIPRVLDADEIVRFNSGMFDTLEQWMRDFPVPFKRNDPSTWISYLQLLPFHSMLLQCYGIGHSQHSWDVRQNPKVVDIFAKLWSVKQDELIVSFDGAGIGMPPEQMGNRGWFIRDWFHSDQRYSFSEFECVQSWVTGYDVGEGDATLVVLEKSHNFHKDFATAFPPANKTTYAKDWFKFDKPEMTQFYLDKGCARVPIMCPAGSMVFWDSRTVHCGNQPVRGRTPASTVAKPKFRNVSYICMVPRRWASKAKLQRKQAHFKQLRTARHRPDNDTVFGKTPHTYGREVPTPSPLLPPTLTPLGLKLAGF